MAKASFEVGDLVAVIGDNSPDEEHGQRAGYNGVWALRHRTGDRSLFVPGISGLNLEHIISGEGEEDRDVFFEPRRAPMGFRRLGETGAELHQPPTPTFFLESWTRIELREPHYLDMTFRCRATQHVFPYGYIGLFWASYINGPLDKSMYFPGGWTDRPGTDLWSQLCTPAHNRDSTVRGRNDDFRMTFMEGSPNALYKNFSPLVWDRPCFYGHFEDHVFLVMIDGEDTVRLTHSPSGGGVNRDRSTTNPAWDFQYIIPDYEINMEYELRVRTVFRERCPREEIEAELDAWMPGRESGDTNTKEGEP